MHLERRLGGRKVFDAVTGREVPDKNVWAEMTRFGELEHWDSAAGDAPDRWAAEGLDQLAPEDYDDLRDAG